MTPVVQFTSRCWRFAIFVAIVLLVRIPFYGSPAVHIDEQFYLMVADKWVHHGLIPFVDIWDRKPVGTFLVYTIPVLLFQNAILAYQIFATAFVIATGAIIMRIGKIVFDEDIGFAAAIIYAVAVVLMEGPGGQTPIFYNLFIVSAFWLYLRAARAECSNVRALVLVGSLLFGLALQIKYICVIEAAALSLFLLFDLTVRRRLSGRQIALLAAGMVVCGILPTVIVAAEYGLHGHVQEFFEANFVSIFTKRLWHLSALEYLHRLFESSLFCVFFLPFAAYAIFSIATDRMNRYAAEQPKHVMWGRAAIVLWLSAALPGALGLGNPTRHYFLPTLMPLALLTAYGLQRLEQSMGRIGRSLSAMRMRWGRFSSLIAILIVPIIGAFVIADQNPLERGEASDVYAVASYMKRHLSSGECPFVFNRLPILYYLADACAPSVYAFPNHLSEIAEVQTPGRERLVELTRVLQSKPPLIYVRRPYSTDIDPEAITMLEDDLDQFYMLDYVRRGYKQFHVIYTLKPKP